MKLEPKLRDDDIEVDMSPMIDMVFLLLIFFIVASQVIDEKPKVEVPFAAYAIVPEDTTGRMIVTVTKDEKIFVGSAPDPIQGLDALRERITTEIKANPKLRILLRCDADTKYKINEKVMNVCASVGAADLIFSAFEE